MSLPIDNPVTDGPSSSLVEDMERITNRYAARIEVPRGGFVKYGATDTVDFVSPVPCPYNYGSVQGFVGEDGEPLDAVVLGPRLTRGEIIEAKLVGVVFFRDAGLVDDKLILSPTGAAPGRIQRAQLRLFFRIYSLIKRAAHTIKGHRGPTVFEGLGSKPRKQPSLSAPR